MHKENQTLIQYLQIFFWTTGIFTLSVIVFGFLNFLIAYERYCFMVGC